MTSSASASLPEECAKQWDILLLLLSSEEKNIDRTCDSEVDTMTYFYNNEGVRKILLQWLQQMQATYAKKTSESDTALKCDEVSLLWRQRGNDKFRANCVEESYRCYSKSVMYAPQAGAMYPLALANRSAALLRLKRFKECLMDVTLAISSGYPEEQRHKLLLRRGDCHIELGQREEARAALAAAALHAAQLTLSAAQLSEFERHVKLLERKLELSAPGPMQQQEMPGAPACYMGENASFSAASDALELRRSEAAGRFVAARSATRRGDVLFSEEPYAWVTLPADEPACEACCRPAVNCVPCEWCSRAAFCGEACRARARTAFHRWECAGARAALFPAIGIAHLALRVLLLTTSGGFPPAPAPSPASAAALFREYARLDNIRIYSADTPPFYRMFNLVTNFDKMNNTDYIQYAVTATLLTLYLENFTSFFEQLPRQLPCALPAAELRVFAAALVLRSLGQLVCNGHATLGLCTVHEEDGAGTGGRTLAEREVRRATAIYPSAAMMNHSCDPNIINTFYNSRLVVVSARALPAGGEVLNCYGPHRARDTTPRRRAALRAQYHFLCACAACEDPERTDFALLFSAYACPACKGPVVAGAGAGEPRCQQCRAPFRPERARALLDRADDLAAHAEQATGAERRCELMHAALRVRQQVWHRHHARLRAAGDRLARLHADLGEFSKSVELIKQNIQSLEYQFGSFSVEVAHELRKLSEVMLERTINSPQNPDYREWCLETHKIIKKAVQLMELNYGAWEPLVARLREQEALVAALLAGTPGTPDAGDCVHRTLHYNLKI